MAWHITNHLVGRPLIVKDLLARRVAAAAILEVLRDRGLLAFHVPDNHLHLLIEAPRDEALQAARFVESSIVQRLRLPVGFSLPHAVEVSSMSGMERCFSYILDQRRHHGMEADPLAESSCIPDLLGLRVSGAWLRPRVRAAFPRLPSGMVLSWLGLPDLDGPPNPADLLAAAASAVGEGSTESRRPRMVLARAAAAEVGAELGLEAGHLAAFLGVSARTLSRLRELEVPPELARAVRLQLGARSRLRVPQAAGERRAPLAARG